MTLSIKGLFATHNINDTAHFVLCNDDYRIYMTYAECQYAEYHYASVMAPFKH
jgi:hypothetical protein